MKIRIEMTAEELNKGIELTTTMFPGIDTSSYLPIKREQIEAKCNAYEMSNIIDPEIGVVTEMEIKTHFIIWMLRKMKPFVTTFVALWHMFTDLFEDIQLMMGDVTILHNGEDLCETLSKMAEESSYFDNASDDYAEQNQTTESEAK